MIDDECWVYVIFFARVVMSEHLCWACRGVRGGVQSPRIFFSHWDDIFMGPHDI
jgi:hypothetical protein